jgi:hypothetical protein
MNAPARSENLSLFVAALRVCFANRSTNASTSARLRWPRLSVSDVPPLLVEIKRMIDVSAESDPGNFPPAVRRKCRNKLENSSPVPIIWTCHKVHDRMNDWSERKVLSSDEWDFREISKPELWICWHYEFAREAVRIDPRLLRPTTEWRAGAPERFHERLKYLRQHPLISIGGWLGLLSPEWPDRSYLFLESDERRSRIEQLRKYYSTLPASPIAAHVRNPLIPVKSRVEWNLISPMLEEQWNRSPDKMSIPNVTVGEGSDQVSTVILQLDWSRGRTEILRAFGDLLSKMEAQDMKGQDPMEGGTELDHRATELRALGGWRIKRFEAAINDCQRYYNLYETIGAYYKAEEKAVKITRKYFLSLFSDQKTVLTTGSGLKTK